MNKGIFTSARQNWKTPSGFYAALNAEFGFNDDPCPARPKADGLQRPWGGRVFLNPPYKEIKAWMAKVKEEADKGSLIVCLVPARTDTSWWHDVVMTADTIRFIRGRLRFDDGNGRAPFPSAVVIFNCKK